MHEVHMIKKTYYPGSSQLNLNHGKKGSFMNVYSTFNGH